MSEYQYYRFECLDSTLSPQQQKQLRDISSRAEITSSSFQVYYNYSDLKEDPDQLMKQYFDVGFYYADWGEVILWLKLPPQSLPETFTMIDDGFSAIVWNTNKYQLLRLVMDEDDRYRDDDDAERFFTYLRDLRAELISKDYRLLYLCWLIQAHNNDSPPPLPRIAYDFSQLTEAQQAFADLFGLSEVPVRALAELLSQTKNHATLSSRPLPPERQLRQLSAEDKDRLLYALFEQGQLSSQQALAMLNENTVPDHWRYWLKAEDLDPYMASVRDEMNRAYQAREAERKAQEKAEKERYMEQVFANREVGWKQAKDGADSMKPKGYDQATATLQELFDAYCMKGILQDFIPRFQCFLSDYATRPSLMRRLEGLKKAVETEQSL